MIIRMSGMTAQVANLSARFAIIGIHDHTLSCIVWYACAAHWLLAVPVLQHVFFLHNMYQQHAK